MRYVTIMAWCCPYFYREFPESFILITPARGYRDVGLLAEAGIYN